MTAQEFVQKKINPRIDDDYDLSLTGKQLFELLDEYAAMQPETTELKMWHAAYTDVFGDDQILDLYMTACCDYNVDENDNFCPSCGRRIKK